MSDRVHHVELTEETERRLRDRAAAAGTDAETFIRQAVEEKLRSPKSFREIFLPLQQAFEESGADSAELEQFFHRLRKSVRGSADERQP